MAKLQELRGKKKKDKEMIYRGKYYTLASLNRTYTYLQKGFLDYTMQQTRKQN